MHTCVGSAFLLGQQFMFTKKETDEEKKIVNVKKKHASLLSCAHQKQTHFLKCVCVCGQTGL